jgi:hypothetical protein
MNCFKFAFEFNSHHYSEVFDFTGDDDDDDVDQAELAAAQKRIMELFVHATSCQVLNCGSPKCNELKLLFKHATACQLKAGSGC